MFGTCFFPVDLLSFEVFEAPRPILSSRIMLCPRSSHTDTLVVGQLLVRKDLFVKKTGSLLLSK